MNRMISGAGMMPKQPNQEKARAAISSAARAQNNRTDMPFDDFANVGISMHDGSVSSHIGADRLRTSTEDEREVAGAKYRAEQISRIGHALGFQSAAFQLAITQACGLITEAMELQGFWDIPEQAATGVKIALMHSELSEALEADRNGIANDDKIREFTGLEAELADTVIRIFDFAGHHNMRLGAAIMAKMAYNLQREFRHGKGY